MFELSFEAFIKIYKLGSLGKLMGGLIHNINGPLQNIGLDLEMAEYMLKKDDSPCEQKIEKLQSRLTRIEEELNRLNSMIETASSRTLQIDQNKMYVTINDFLEQELSFLNANLYFKHNIDKSLEPVKDPPFAARLPHDSLQAMGWLLQIMAEDMEKNRVEGFNLAVKKESHIVKIVFSTKNGLLSSSITNLIDQEKISAETIAITNDNYPGLVLALAVFEKDGVKTECRNGSDKTEVILEFPLSD